MDEHRGGTVGAKRKRPDSSPGRAAHPKGAHRRNDGGVDTAAAAAGAPRKLDVRRYTRGEADAGIAKQTKDLKLKASIKRKESEFRNAARDAARAELLLTEESG